MTERSYHCPQCDSDRVVTEEHEQIFVNTLRHYCHSMNRCDRDSPATCLVCGWEGQRCDLKEKNT
jgi:predicted Zn-ribbon and HTH transcriptional regulator